MPFLAHFKHDGSVLSQMILRREHWKQPFSFLAVTVGGISAVLSPSGKAIDIQRLPGLRRVRRSGREKGETKPMPLRG